MVGRVHRLLVAMVLLVLAGCSSNSDSAETTETGTSSPSAPREQRYPDVIDVAVEQAGETFSFDVTISSPYDTPERYADGWRILGRDGTVYGEHTLAHDHANEQPFTRTQNDVEIPPGVEEVTVEGRDSEYGFGGATVTVQLPASLGVDR